jgi:hypothetical protein
MTLRDHPFLTYQGIPSWPPPWLWTGGEKDANAQGEVGILQDVKTHDAMSSHCFLFIDHEGATFIGRLSCDSSALCPEVVKTLKRYRGQPLRSMGELGIDMPHTPSSEFQCQSV